jgi:hypothetical protein
MTTFKELPASCDHTHREYKRSKTLGVILMIVCKNCGAILFMRPGKEEK